MGKNYNNDRFQVFRTQKNSKLSSKSGESMSAEHTSLELSLDLELTETGIINMLLTLMSIEEIKAIWKFGKWRNHQKRKSMVLMKNLPFKCAQISGENPARESMCKLLSKSSPSKIFLETEVAGAESELYKNFLIE